MMYSYTIIIPHYNIPKLLMRCVSSIPRRNDIQVIVVDDCSPQTPELQDVFTTLRGRDVEIYFTHKGGSAGRARNVGLSHAKGKWIIFADADDFFDDDFAAICDEVLNRPEMVLCFKSRSVDSDNIHLPSDRANETLQYFNESCKSEGRTFFRFRAHMPWGKIVRRSFIVDNNILFDETKYANDAMFAIKLGCLTEQFMLIDRSLYVVTTRRGSLCDGFCQKPGETSIRTKVALRVRKYIIDHGFPVVDDYDIYVKLLVWATDKRALWEIYNKPEIYGIKPQEVHRIIYSAGRRHILLIGYIVIKKIWTKCFQKFL